VEFASFIRQVGANLRRARWAAEMTQEEVAAAALTFRLLAELERGRGNPTLRTLFLLAKALDVTVKDLVDVEKSSRPPLNARKATPPKRGRKPKPRRPAKP
jgi:transcriptional regulator with XRE-family HTH domain